MYSAAQEQFGNNPFAQLLTGNGGIQQIFFFLLSRFLFSFIQKIQQHHVLKILIHYQILGHLVVLLHQLQLLLINHHHNNSNLLVQQILNSQQLQQFQLVLLVVHPV
jgi:hypothetical protein